MTLVKEKTAPAVDIAACPVLASLVGLIRATDTFGAWEKKSDATLLKDYIVTKEERRQIPIIGDPDPDVLGRIEHYFQAIGLAIERKTGMMASPMMKMSHEGFGRVILTVGRLVVVSKSLRDVHRFGFVDLAALSADGMKYVDQAVAMISRFPDVAQA